MYREKLEAILEQYAARFDEMNEKGKNKSDAGHKWEVMQACSTLNLDSDELLLEFENFAENTNRLMESSRVQPSGGITILLQHDEEVEFVRSEFKDLLRDDGGDLEDRQDRIVSFVDDINRHLSMYMDKIDIYKQTLSSAIGYLSLVRPKENYYYRPSTADSWAMSIEFSEDFGHNRTFSLRKYYKMCDEILQELKDFPRVLELNQKRVDDLGITVDDDLHMLVYDIMLCTDTYHLDANKEKMTVKERLSRAVIREERENLMDRLLDVEDRLRKLSADVELPDPVGSSVEHKTFGSGIVKSCSGGKIEVEFPAGIKKFQYPDAFARGFLKSDDESVMQKFKENADIVTERRNLRQEQTQLEDSLRHIG